MQIMKISLHFLLFRYFETFDEHSLLRKNKEVYFLLNFLQFQCSQIVFAFEKIPINFPTDFPRGTCGKFIIFKELQKWLLFIHSYIYWNLQLRRYCMKIPHLRFPNFLCWVCNARSNAENYEQIKTLKRRKLRAHSCNWRRTMHQVKRKLLCLLKVSELLAFNFQSKLHLFTSCRFYTCSSREMMRRLTCLFAAFFSKHRLQLIIEVWVHCFPCCIK